MIVVSHEKLQQASLYVEELSEKEAIKWHGSLAKQQPILMEFILSAEEVMDSDFDFGHFLRLALVSWRAFLLEIDSLPPIGEPHIAEKQQTQVDEAARMEDMSEEELAELAVGLMQSMVQPVLIAFISEELMRLVEEEEIEGGDSAASAMFPILKIIIEVLDDAANKPRMRIV